MPKQRTLRFGILVVMGLASFGPARGADVDSDAVEEIVIVGTRIPRQDFESASPIVTVEADEFRQSASSSVETVLGRLPQFVPDNGAFQTLAGGDPGGRATLNLRGLGAHSTLVLLDGKRLVPSFGDGAVDVNIIPPALVERVEIISGGASAVYGSDAVGGVVNFKLRDRFEGVEIDGSWGRTDQDDGDEQSIGISAGTAIADGRGHVVAHLGYADRDGVTLDEREFSEYGLGFEGPGNGVTGPDASFVPLGSFTTAEAKLFPDDVDPMTFDNVFAAYGFEPGSVPYPQPVAVNEDSSLFTTGDGDPGSVVNYRGPRDPVLFNDAFYSFNFNPYNYLQLPLERTTAFGRASFELGPSAELFGQVLYTDYSADLAAAPTPANSPLYLPRSNPYIPQDLATLLDSRPEPAAETVFFKRFVEVGPRRFANDFDALQATFGVRGELAPDWRYEAYAQYGDNDRRERQQGNVLRSRLFDLLFAADGGESICGEFDPLRVGHIAPACLDYISVDGTNESSYTQTIVEFSAVGPVASLPAGKLTLAVGAMYKRDEYSYGADAIGSVFLEDEEPDIQGFLPADDIDDSDHNTDIYLEASIPLVADRPGVQWLEAVLGYRRSEYDSAGAADAWKAEVLYRPNDMLLLRGSLQRAVRAPSVFELYLPRLPITYFFDEVTDPCVSDSEERTGPDAAAVEALCVAQGVPPELLADFEQEFAFTGVSGGNPELEPEDADTATIGFVLAPAFEHPLLADVQLSVDWYRIEVADSIDQVIAPDTIPQCFDATVNPTLSATNYWCGFFSRDAETGQIDDSLDTLINYADREVTGVDTQIDWRFPVGTTVMRFNGLASWMDEFTVSPYRGMPKDEGVGVVGGGAGGSRPEWKLNLQLRADWQWLGVGVAWRYIDGMHDADAPGLGWGEYRVPSQHYYDCFAEVHFEGGAFEGLRFSAGVENLTDQQPPLIPSWIGANTDPSQFDVLGRRYYVNASYRL
jgi:outer membrane receptor protein involved in Fe transport